MANGKPLSQAALAKALDLSPAMVSKLKGQGMPVSSVRAARAWRAKHLNIAAVGGNGRAADRDPEFNRARTSRERSDAELSALAVLERRRVLVHRDVVKAEMARRLSTLREAMLQLPARVAAETTDPTVHDILQGEVHMLLALIAEVAA